MVVSLVFSGGFNFEFVNWDDQTYIKLNYLFTNPNGHWGETYMNRGNVYLNAQMPEKALPDLEKAMRMPKLKDKKLTRGSLATAQLNVGK